MRTKHCGAKKNPHPSQESSSNFDNNMLDDVGKL
jgi:hypothetical protein